MNEIKQHLATAILLAGMCATAMAKDGISNDYRATEEIGFYDAFGEDEFALNKNSLQGAIQSNYLFVAGSAFNARNSTQIINYPGAGCTYSDAAVTTDLQLPGGANILGVRTYFYNNGEPNKRVTTYLTSYDGLGGMTDLLVNTSSTANGYNSEYYQPQIPVTVDNYEKSYVLTATIDNGLRFCGMRVFYNIL